MPYSGNQKEMKPNKRMWSCRQPHFSQISVRFTSLHQVLKGELHQTINYYCKKRVVCVSTTALARFIHHVWKHVKLCVLPVPWSPVWRGSGRWRCGTQCHLWPCPACSPTLTGSRSRAPGRKERRTRWKNRSSEKRYRTVTRTSRVVNRFLKAVGRTRGKKKARRV